MKPRFSIPGKIVALFLANIAILAGGLAWVLHQGWGMMAMPAFRSDKLERVAAQLFPRLEATAPAKWSELLDTLSQEHGVTFYLYSSNGPRLAGPADFLPGNVHSEITGGPRGKRRPPPIPPAFGGPDEPPPNELRPIERAPSITPNSALTLRPILSSPDGYWCVASGFLEKAVGPEKVWLITRSLSPTGDGFYADTHIIYWIIAAAIFLSVLVWLPFILPLASGIRKMQGTAGKLALGDFTARADEKRNDELGALGHSVNHMADQIGSLVDGQKRLLGDIAHELSSPIARMQAIVGILEVSEGIGATSGRHLIRLDAELQEMANLVSELLSLSRANLRRCIELRPIPLRQQVERAIEREQCADGQIIRNIPDTAVVMSDPELLTRAIGNVLRNAIRYAGSEGPITITAEVRGEEIAITISDNGPGVPEASIPRLFDAFYRPDIARTRDTGGAGLGLAIVKSCVEATQGSVTARNRSGGGLVVEIRQLNQSAHSAN